MKLTFSILLFCFLTSHKNLESQKSIKNEVVIFKTDKAIKSTQNKLSILVLPPFDDIGNAGISPDIQKYLEASAAL